MSERSVLRIGRDEALPSQDFSRLSVGPKPRTKAGSDVEIQSTHQGTITPAELEAAPTNAARSREAIQMSET